VAELLAPEVKAAAAAVEDDVRAQIWRALAELLPPPPGPAPPATLGPLLHRWGAAFSAPQRGLAADEAWVAAAGLAFCGDFVQPATPQTCNVEVAATSGLAAARNVLGALAAAGEPAAAAATGGDGAWHRLVYDGAAKL
jgi:predicted NAD/FAD-dependent oxidoreductase